jgi:hypothetical protein
MIQETDRQLEKMSAETNRRTAETDRWIAEAGKRMAETDRLMREAAKWRVKTDRAIGKPGSRLREVIEHIMSPKLREKFERLGFSFNHSSRNHEIRDRNEEPRRKQRGIFVREEKVLRTFLILYRGSATPPSLAKELNRPKGRGIRPPPNKNRLAEVDILLENGEYALAVEVKTHLTTKDVKDHIKRMGILRRVADEHNDKRKYLGAVAGAVVDQVVTAYALKNGFYVITPSGKTVDIEAPDGFNPRIW